MAKRIYTQGPVDDEVRCPILGLSTRRNHIIGKMVELALIKFDYSDLSRKDPPGYTRLITAA